MIEQTLSIREAALAEYGFSPDEIDEHMRRKRTSLIVQQQAEEEQQSEEDSVFGGIKEYWGGIIDSVKESAASVKEGAVGEDFEFDEYWKRGLGKSTLSLAKEYHSNGGGVFDANIQRSLEQEPQDTGHIERAIETIGTLVGDIPVGGLSAAAGAAVSGGNMFFAGASAGFVTEGMRQTYIEALQRGQVETPEEWWEIFIEKGLGEATKAGIVTGAGLAAPGLVGRLGGQSALLKYGAQYGVFAGLGPALEGRLPSKDELINVGLVMGGLGGAGMAAKKGTDMIMKRVGSSNKSTQEVLEEVAKNPDMLEDALSSNIKEFRRPIADGDKLEAAFEGAKPMKKKPDAEEQAVQQRLDELNEPLMTDDAALASIASTISYGKKTSKILGNLVDAKNRAVTQYIDKLHPIFIAEKAFEKSGGKLNEAITAYQQARTQPGQIGKGMSFLNTGTFDFFSPISKVGEAYKGKSYREIFNNYSAKDMLEWDSYAKSKRAIEKDAQGFKTGVDITAARQVVKLLEVKHAKAFREIREFQDAVLDYAVDGGLISKEQAAAYRKANQDYVPFQRDIEPDASGAFSKNVSNPFKKFTGSDLKTFSPAESIMLNTMTIMSSVEKNFSNVKFIELVEANPAAFPGISKSVARAKATRLTRKELENIVDNPKALKDDVVDGFSVFRRDGHQLSDSEIVVFRKGKREVWEVGKELADVFKDASMQEAGLITKLMEPFSKSLRLGATLAPDFVVRNATRDTFSAAIFSHETFVPMYHTLTGFKSLILRGDKMYENFVKSGAMQSMFISMDRNYFAKDMKQFMQAEKAHNVITNPLEWLRVTAEMFETSSRLGNFKLSYNRLKRNQNLTDKEILEGSGFAARDVTLDFGRIGTRVAGWNRINAFFNATIQGHVKLYESFKRNPIRTTARINAYIVAPSIALWLINHNDERYKQLPRWQKDLFWIFITGDGTVEDGDYTVWRVPKPYGPGVVFGTGTERTLDHFVDQDPDAMAAFVKEQVGVFSTLTGMIPDFFRPALEISTNTSFFTKKPVVPRYLEKGMQQYQYTEYTTETGKLIGKWLAETTNGAMGSPAAVDHVISSWTGTLGRYALELSDKLLKKFDVVDTPEKPLDTLADVPFIRAFVVRNPTGGSEYVERFYRRFEKIRERLESVEKLIEENNAEEALRVHSESDLSLLPLIQMQKAMSAQSRWIKAIYNSDMTPAEKRQSIDETYRAMISIAKMGVELADSSE